MWPVIRRISLRSIRPTGSRDTQTILVGDVAGDPADFAALYPPYG
jgi:hypothetical protein